MNLVYSYDPLSRLTNVLANGSATAEYGFDLVGNLQTMRYSNGVTNLYQYDSLNRLTNLVWKTNGTTIGSFAYQLGLTGNRTNLTETLNSQPSTTYAWSYDALYRLTNENISTLGNLGYGYDAVGNRTNRNSGVTGLTNQIFAFNTNDWLTIDSYDSNGNTTNSSSNFYQYDALNHLTNVNSGAILMTYDGDGNRASKKMNGTTTFYLLDDRNPSGYVQVLEEQTVTSTATNLAFVYNYGLSLISHKRVGNGAIRYYGLDGHGSTRFLTDGPTVTLVTDTLTYDAYGNLIAWTGGSAKKYLYCCEQWDQDLGMYLLRARYYAPGTGRFWAMDMYQGNNEDPLSLHKYLYCQGNPVDNTDPSGNDIGEMIGVMDIGGLISRNSIPSGVSGYTSIIVPTVDVHFDRLRSLGKSWHHAYLLLHQIGLPTIGFRGGPSIQGGHGYLTEKGSGLAVGGGFPDTDSDPGNPNNDVAKVGVTIPFTTYDHLRQEFQQVADHIESLHVPYHGIKGPNSNSFVKTLLVKNGLNAPRPPVWAPAWDVSIY